MKKKLSTEHGRRFQKCLSSSLTGRSTGGRHWIEPSSPGGSAAPLLAVTDYADRLLRARARIR